MCTTHRAVTFILICLNCKGQWQEKVLKPYSKGNYISLFFCVHTIHIKIRSHLILSLWQAALSVPGPLTGVKRIHQAGNHVWREDDKCVQASQTWCLYFCHLTSRDYIVFSWVLSIGSWIHKNPSGFMHCTWSHLETYKWHFDMGNVGGM